MWQYNILILIQVIILLVLLKIIFFKKTSNKNKIPLQTANKKIKNKKIKKQKIDELDDTATVNIVYEDIDDSTRFHKLRY